MSFYFKLQREVCDPPSPLPLSDPQQGLHHAAQLLQANDIDAEVALSFTVQVSASGGSGAGAHICGRCGGGALRLTRLQELIGIGITAADAGEGLNPKPKPNLLRSPSASFSPPRP
jgi:hypothetical protein